MLTESGTLAVGISYEGKVHKSFVLRATTGRDTAEAFGEGLSQSNDVFFSLALLAKRIEAIGDIPKEAITLDMVLDAAQIDIDQMNMGARRLDQRLQMFLLPPGNGDQSSDNAGVDENRLQPGANQPNA